MIFSLYTPSNIIFITLAKQFALEEEKTRATANFPLAHTYAKHKKYRLIL